jgi:PAS domain S-box-containing protein
MVDAQGMFVHVSAAARQVFGYAPEELIGRRMIDLVLPEDRERTLQAAQRVMAGQTHLNFENRYRRKDGQVVHLLWSARWLPEAGLRVAVARDITERKRAEQVSRPPTPSPRRCTGCRTWACCARRSTRASPT